MSNQDFTRIRSLALVGHGGAGKTTVADAIARRTGLSTRLGSTVDGTSLLDFEPEEQARAGSVQSSLITTEFEGFRMHVVDTPGDGNFLADGRVALQAADAAVIVISAVDGVEASTERMSQAAADLGLARAIFLNKMDSDRAHAGDVLDEIKEVLGLAPAVLQVPIGVGPSFRGVVDLINQQAFTYSNDSGEPSVGPVPDDMSDAVTEALEALVEAVAETDDDLLEKYLDAGELSSEEVRAGLNAGILSGKLAPVLYGAAASNIGVDRLLWAARALPSPAERAPVSAAVGEDEEPTELELGVDGPPVALCVKTIIDPFAGQVSIFRVFSGVVKTNDTLHNSRTGKDERFGHIFHLVGKKHVDVEEVLPGDIFGVAKLRDTHTGDTLYGGKSRIRVDAVKPPPPMASFVVRPKARGDDDKIKTAMQRMLHEDVGLQQGYDPVTKELVVSGMGNNHITVTMQRVRRKYGIDVELDTPTIPYRETITGTADVRYRHKKQTGGAGQFGEVAIKVRPSDRGAGFIFEDNIVGGVIPNSLIPSVEKGVRYKLEQGVLAGFPVVDVTVSLYDGKTHPVDSKDIAFQIAGRQAIKEAVMKCRPVLLEPIYEVEIVVPADSVGDIMGDMNSRRGRIQNMENRGRNAVVKAMVPLSEVQNYAPDLNSMTGGKGSYTMHLHQYEPVPAHMQDKLVAEIKRVQEDEE